MDKHQTRFHCSEIVLNCQEEVLILKMRTDIPEPWKCVGGHDPAVVVHDLPRHSCKSIQKVKKVLFSVLTVAFILHALDS